MRGRQPPPRLAVEHHERYEHTRSGRTGAFGGGACAHTLGVMSFWTFPKSRADRWRALIVVCELCILVLCAAAMVACLVTFTDSERLDYRIEPAYARAMTPVAYFTLGISLVLGASAAYRRRFAGGRELFWPAVLIAILGLCLTAVAWPHITPCK